MATITSLNNSDSGSTSRTTINTNFTNLNTDLEKTKIIYKSSDETVNGSDTLQDDNELTFAIGANEKWAFTIYLRTSSGATPDFKYSLSVPSGATFTFWSTYNVTQVSNLGGGYTDKAVVDGSGSFPIGSDIANGSVINSSTTGSVTLQWAQNTSNASDTKLLAGSYIIAHKLA